jgi:hypothetical protein
MKTRLLASLSRLACLLGMLCLAACTRPPVVSTSSEDPTCCESHYPTAAFQQYSTQQLGQEYQRLRRLKCQACNRYGSDFHQLMKELGTRLNGQPRTTVRHIMGRPDSRSDSTLVYYWRTTHDYLRFRPVADGTVVSSWYLALE